MFFIFLSCSFEKHTYHNILFAYITGKHDIHSITYIVVRYLLYPTFTVSLYIYIYISTEEMALLSRFLYVVGAIIVLSATLAVAHMEMMSPPPFKSKYNPYATDVDYDLTAPISQGQFPCKGYQSLIGTPEGTCVATWEAGSDQSFT